MYNRPEQVLEQYDLEVKSVGKSREGYLCDTNLGQKLLKEYQGSKERAEFLADVLLFLNGHGILTETIQLTGEGAPLAVNEEGTKYLLLDAFSGSECDTRSRSDMMAAVRTLAAFHNAAEQYQGNVPEFIQTNQDSLLLLYEKHNRELNKVKRYVRSRNRKNEFEMLFVSCHQTFAEQALMTTGLLKKLTPEKESFGFCHGDYNQHNIIFTKRGPAIAHFDRFSYHIRVSDLANFIRKMLEKNNWNTGLGLDLIRAYHEVRNMTPQELQYLYIYLAYPEKFWKIANHYYNSHKAWMSGRNVEKLEKMIAQEENRAHFLQILFSFNFK